MPAKPETKSRKPETKQPTVKTAARKTSGIAGDPTEFAEDLFDGVNVQADIEGDDAPSDGLDRSTWQGCPIEDLDLTLTTHEYLKAQNITTIGQLADRLDSLAGLKAQERWKLQGQIDDARGEE